MADNYYQYFTSMKHSYDGKEIVKDIEKTRRENRRGYFEDTLGGIMLSGVILGIIFVLVILIIYIV